MATLYVLQGPDKGQSHRTEDEQVLIGRSSPQVPLTDQTVSRRHAELRRVEDGWTIRDLNSANGTYLNGVRLQRSTRLKRGDQIRVGSTLLVYGGDESLQQFTGSGIPTDLVTLDVGAMDASVVASVPAMDDSVVMAAPETAYAVKAWNAMRDIAAVIGSLLPQEQLLARVVDIIFEQLQVDRVVVFVKDEPTGELLPEVVRFHAREAPRGKSHEHEGIVASRTIMNHVVASREGVLCSNVLADARFQSGKSVHNMGMRSVICAPIMSRDHVLGVIHVDSQVTRHTFNEHELKLLVAIGNQTGLAIENQRLVHLQVQRERLAAAGETVAYLSHYIKNILQGMRSGADIVTRGLGRKDLAVAAQGWGIVERNLDRSYNLMLNMLAFSKQREPRLEMLQVNKIAEEVVALVQKQADDGRTVLLADLDEAVPAAPLDYDGIHQVILNLIENALDAVRGRPQAVINVRTRYDAERKQVVLTVTDNGPGVPVDQRARIFEPFHSTKGHGGTGLGLAVAKKIVNELHGTIELVSPPDGGAEFVVRLAQVTPEEAGDTMGGTR